MVEYYNDTESVVFVFTKNRIDRLNLTLPRLPAEDHDFIIIDDSSSIKIRKQVKKLCNQFGLIYHGPREQKKFFSEVNSPLTKYFTTTLGKNNWSLGYNRNYAILYSNHLKKNKIIFMDDDVIIHKPADIRITFDGLRYSSFVGANIDLMPDDSVLGHVYRVGNRTLEPRYISGTYLGFNTNRIRHFFINKYNEDWIWLFLENGVEDIKTKITVDQMKFDSFLDWETKVVFQEEGEILWEGVYFSSKTNRQEELTNPNYWNAIFENRFTKIQYIDNLSLHESVLSVTQKIKKMLLDYHENLNPEYFSKIFIKYFSDLVNWEILLNEVRN